jgi:AcrR family transcriptional regulator
MPGSHHTNKKTRHSPKRAGFSQCSDQQTERTVLEDLPMPIAAKYAAIDSRILEAASTLFSTQGYKGTTTREIALIAGVSENSLFRHFHNKEGIFWAAFEWRVSRIDMRRELQESLREQRSLEVVLPQLVAFLSYIVVYQSELIRLLSVAFLELPEQAESTCSQYLAPILGELSRYFARSAGKRELSTFESTLLAAAFVSAPILHPIYYRLVVGNEPPFVLDTKERVRAYVNCWLSVLNQPNKAGVAYAAAIPVL